MKIKISDLVAEILKKNGVKNIFGLQGGSIVHLFDSFEKKKLNVSYNFHEQSASLAAVANAKASSKPTCCLVTTGPGSSNAMTGLLAAWQDSVPCIFISGQARTNHTSYGKKVRQVGTQGLNILDIVKPITKGTFLLKNEFEVKSKIEQAIALAISGRPGPVWIDFPVNLTWEKITRPKLNKVKIIRHQPNRNEKKIKLLNKMIISSKKIILVLGYGLRLSGQAKNLLKIIKSKNIPFVTTWNAKDIYRTDLKQNLGVLGMYGHRGANMALFDSNLIICLGTKLGIPHTGTLFDKYARNSKKVMINDDKEEIDNSFIKFDLSINQKIENIFKKINFKNQVQDWQLLRYKSLNWVEQAKSKKPNSKEIISRLTELSPSPKCVITDGSGNALYTTYHCSKIKEGDRLICSAAISSMGAGLPETFGVGILEKFRKIICVSGDGSFIMNLQDLQSIANSKVNCLILVVNNNGYKAIRDTQKEFLNKRYFGSHPSGRLKFPEFRKVVESFNIKYFSIKKKKGISDIFIKKLFKINEPIVLEIKVSQEEEILFKQSFEKQKNKFKPLPLNVMDVGTR
jgi:acetolactate synthase I/II/III large subunit